MMISVSNHNHADDEDGTTNHDEDGGGLTQEKREEIAKQESQALFWLRVLVMLVLVGSAIAVVVIVYLYMTNQEEEEFEQAFQNSAAKLYESIGKMLDQTLGATDAFAVNRIVYARSSNSEWPFVTMPAFGLQVSKLLKLSKAFSVAVTHIVQPEDRAKWEQYTKENNGWMEESLDVMENDEDWKGPIYRNPPSYDTICSLVGLLPDGGDDGTIGLAPNRTFYNPGWQEFPLVYPPRDPNVEEFNPAIPYNYDLMHIAGVDTATLQSYQEPSAVFMPPTNLVYDRDDPIGVLVAQSAQDWARKMIPPEDDPTEPMGSLSYPMFDAVDSVRIDFEDKKDLPKAVGTVIFNFFWRETIRDILPPGSNGIVAVFDFAGCVPPFTYRVDGPKTTFLGPFDQHDPKYDHMGQANSLADIMKITKESHEGSSYTGIPVTQTFCPVTIHLYPSQEMEDDYLSNNPLIFTLAAAAIFLFTSLVFITYDCIVARRQRIVMQRALASGAIVSSLFPEKVRQQLYQDREQEGKEHAFKMKDAFRNSSALLGDASNNRGSSKPIADLFNETTIFFADLAGFTAWSSSRAPVEVFQLLECVYGGFDKIAMKRKVFKVETIGDCYVAATGIPEPQKNHAVIMCRFARDCMVELNQLTRELADTLGEDTKDLEMRVGLHSGPTTAGVLRGQKGRFQLFGDTVNTAARCESNGVRGRIHVSHATADALREAGKGHWLAERPGGIEAKGKGLMQTYFVNISEPKSIATASVALGETSSNFSSATLQPAQHPLAA